MKNYLIIIILFFSISVSAQYGTERYNGVDRSLTGEQYNGKKKKSNQEKADPAEESMKKLDEALKLDDFQKAVVKQLLEDNKKQQDIIVADDIPDESKMEKIIGLREKLNQKIKEILTPEQKEKFEKLGKKKKL